jgi:hypothetical protein
MNNHRRTGLAGLAISIGLLILLTLAVHFIYAVWPWPEAPRGSGPLREAVIAERARVEELAGGPSIELIGTVIEWAYRITFEWTGLDGFMHSAAEPSTENNADEISKRMAIGLRDLTETFYWSVQLIGLRLGVLLVSLPLFLVAAVGGAVDGAAAWYLRRTRVDRESGFIYHRAKFALWIAIFALCAVYLAPPIPLDPKSVIPPFVAIFAITVRISVAYFKKYL